MPNTCLTRGLTLYKRSLTSFPKRYLIITSLRVHLPPSITTSADLSIRVDLKKNFRTPSIYFSVTTGTLKLLLIQSSPNHSTVQLSISTFFALAITFDIVYGKLYKGPWQELEVRLKTPILPKTTKKYPSTITRTSSCHLEK